MSEKEDENQECLKFNYTIKESLSNLLQRSRAFKTNKKCSDQFSFACVVQDRLFDALNYFNEHLAPPRTRDEFYLFMVYADNMFSAVQEFYKLPIINKSVVYPFENEKKETCAQERSPFFHTAFQKAFPEIPNDKTPTDDDFFKYFRALSFAHPYETSRQGFIDSKNDERHYSPFPLTRDNPGFPLKDDEDIGILVYTNGKGNNNPQEYFYITLHYFTVRKFLISRYNALAAIISYISEYIQIKERRNSRQKINNKLPLTDFFRQLREIYSEQDEIVYLIDEILERLNVTLSSGYIKNENTLSKYKDSIQKTIPLICDAINANDFDTVVNIITKITSPFIPENLTNPNNFGYLNGKISEICSKNDNMWREHIKAYLDYLLKSYASKWIEIDFDKMPKEEILLLLSIANYLEFNILKTSSAETTIASLVPHRDN